MNITRKIIANHLVTGEMIAGQEISIRIDQTLTQDSTGTMAYLQFESLGVDKVKTYRSVAYIDHNTIQSGFENADDHAYIQSVALKHGIYVSKPGNGICHQINIERFGIPGQTLIGSDSHTPTAGGIGMLAIGSGGLDVAVAMGGGALYLTMPKVVKIELVGKLKPNVTAKDIILEVLRRLTVKGGVGKVMEYCGEGVKYLTVPERATITNMGAELGATTSVFPSDEQTLAFLKAQGREDDFTPLSADENATYDEEVVIDLSELSPLVACPHSPDAVKKASELTDIKVDQVCIGSCTNSSYRDLMKVARILKGKKVDPTVSLTISPGSRQVFAMLARNGALADMIEAGARILECACGPCIGMGQSPKNNAVSVRTFNRNFYARSGTASASVYLVSPETAAYTALYGKIVDASTLPCYDVDMPERFDINDNLILDPKDFTDITVERGPNIKPFPLNTALGEKVSGKVLLVAEDNITTDHIMPSNSKLLPYRSNIPYLSNYCMQPVDPEFSQRAKDNGGGFIVAGDNYGQGSSREHAALVPLYLGIKGVIAKSFARIHRDNLINSGILPLTFAYESDYEKLSVYDEITIENAVEQVNAGEIITLKNLTKGYEFECKLTLTARQKTFILAGGVLNSIKK
ncbi:MAG: aconitate hydratase [Clostridia bacterium]|nr:aconitate hydratase [Clostridia bacterium]